MNALATVASPPEAPVRVVLIDDSKIFLGIMFQYLSRLPGIEIVGFTTSVRDALRTLKALQPDLIALECTRFLSEHTCLRRPHASIASNTPRTPRNLSLVS